MITSSLKNLRISRAAMAKVYSFIAEMADGYNVDPLIITNTLIAIKNYIADESYIPDVHLKLDDNYQELKDFVDKAAIRSAKARARHLDKKAAPDTAKPIPAKPAAAEQPKPDAGQSEVSKVATVGTESAVPQKKPRKCNWWIDPSVNRFGY